MENLEKATFAGGCFWCMEPPFDRIDGVVSTTPGYTGGDKGNPTYEEVCFGRTGHIEAIRILYDPQKVSYEELLDVFWMNIDPTDPGGQFADRGNQYTTAIFYHSEEQRIAAQESMKELAESGKYDKPVVTEIRPVTEFYEAEEYHQDYYKKNPVRYAMYKKGSGRERYLERKWEDKE